MKRILFVLILFASSTMFAQSRGYEKSIEVNGGVALDDYSKFSFGLSMINGYRFNENFFIGAIVGYEYFDALIYGSYGDYGAYKSYDPKNLLKLGARAKVNLSKARVSPFLNFDIGGSMQVARTENYPASGLFIEPAFGVDFNLPDNQSLYIMLGYHAQNNSCEQFFIGSSNTSSIEEEKLAALFDIRIGFKF